ncbi:hypothetical protein EV356DRAFT_530495 [Viridothelium virens]|uniref:Monopolin complex subunit Csm1/Pcs1 C-terminal domain-containing protein n=1 Tax=Viridothelium virens TaxID=1048519 RepID=A0A6A6HG18_VIRVR|nr:hypothetical protein EV356DRAFT_530495 [Viridothelium virens]
MAKAYHAPHASLSGMLDASVDNLTESDNDLMLTPDSAVENRAPPKKKVAQSSRKVAANPSKVTKAKAPARRTSGGGAKKAAPKKANTNRKALSDKTNARYESEVEEVEEFDESMEVDEEEPPAPIVANKKKSKPVEQTREREPVKKSRKKQDQYYEDQEQEEDRSAQKLETKKQTRAAPKIPAKKSQPATSKRAPSKERQHVIPETQPDAMDTEPTIMTADEEESVVEPPPPPPAVKPAPISRARSESRQRRPERLRSASASDREGRSTDPALRRKLGDATKKLESLEIKYRNLQEIGGRTAESNFEKLKKASDERAKHSNELIASLKKDLADLQRRFDSQSAEVAACETKAANLSQQSKKFETENKSLKQSLEQAENEKRALTAKVAATRTASVEAATEKEKEKEKKATASVAKNNIVASRTVTAANTEAAKEAQLRQLKEDLYSDLTGLIIRGVKREEGEDVYDCIQTGRNGTLHFHLTVTNPAASNEPKTPSNSYEDAEFGYEPLLDPSRDKELKDVLEDYLQEEIYFPRRQAARFYSKVMDCVTKKIVVEDEE